MIFYNSIENGTNKIYSYNLFTNIQASKKHNKKRLNDPVYKEYNRKRANDFYETNKDLVNKK